MVGKCSFCECGFRTKGDGGVWVWHRGEATQFCSMSCAILRHTQEVNMCEEQKPNCEICGDASMSSISVAAGPYKTMEGKVELSHFYLPSKGNREIKGTSFYNIRELHLCHPCMRAVEDNFRATILYLQVESGAVHAELSKDGPNRSPHKFPKYPQIELGNTGYVVSNAKEQ